MKIVNANVTELADVDILKKIEKCGRICYKSEDKITDTSCFSFVEGLIKRQHLAMTEHATICLSVTERLAKRIKSLGEGTYLHVTLNGKKDRYLISGNVRAWILLFNPYQWSEAEWQDISRIQAYMYMALDEKTYNVLFNKPESIPSRELKEVLLSQEQILNLPELTLEEAHAHLYLTALFTCDRGVTHELVRHRPASFAQESTRYCNYVKDKFGQEIVCIRPTYYNVLQETIWLQAMEQAEKSYFALIESGCTAQQARGVLPTDLKAELVLTANLAEWQHIINLRYHGTTGAPHPKCLEVMTIWYNYVSAKEGYNQWIQ